MAQILKFEVIEPVGLYAGPVIELVETVNSFIPMSH